MFRMEMQRTMFSYGGETRTVKEERKGGENSKPNIPWCDVQDKLLYMCLTPFFPMMLFQQELSNGCSYEDGIAQ